MSSASGTEAEARGLEGGEFDSRRVTDAKRASQPFNHLLLDVLDLLSAQLAHKMEEGDEHEILLVRDVRRDFRACLRQRGTETVVEPERVVKRAPLLVQEERNGPLSAHDEVIHELRRPMVRVMNTQVGEVRFDDRSRRATGRLPLLV